jgi:hypothetical protein
MSDEEGWCTVRIVMGPPKIKKFKKWTHWLKKSRWEEQELMAVCRFLKHW